MSHRYRWPQRTWNGDPSGPHVTRAVVDHVLITGTALGFVGDTALLFATAYDAKGVVIPGVSVDWSSSQPSMISVIAGFCTFLVPGTATITATVDGRAYTTTATAVAALNLTAEHWTIEDQMFPRVLPVGSTFTPEQNTDRAIFDAGEGTYDYTRRVVQAPSDWATGPVTFSLVNGNGGWIETGDLGADANHHNLHWDRFTGTGTTSQFSAIMSGYNLERRDVLPPPLFCGFYIRCSVAGAALIVMLGLGNDQPGVHAAQTIQITTTGGEQYVTLSGLLQGIDNATMLSGIAPCIWLTPVTAADGAKLQNATLDLLGCVPYFGTAPSDLATNPASLNRFRLLKPTAAAIAQGVSVGGMSLSLHPTRGMWIAQSCKNHLPNGTDVGQGSQWGLSSWTVAATAIPGPESSLAGDVWYRWTISNGAALQTISTFTLDTADGSASACAGVYAWVHLLLKQDGANPLPADGVLVADLFAGGPVGSATFTKYTQESTDGTVWTYRARVLVSALNAGTNFTLIIASTAPAQVLASRVAVEREAYVTLSPTISRDAGSYAMAAIQRPFDVTGLGVTPIWNFVRHRYDDAINILSTAAGAMLYRWWCDWDVPTLRAAAVADVITPGRKLCDAGSLASDDSSIIVVIGSGLNVSNKTQICAQCTFVNGAPGSGFKSHTITWALPDDAITRGSFNDIAAYWLNTLWLGLYINGVWYDSSSLSLVNNTIETGTSWDLTHGFYQGQDRDNAAAMNAYLRAFAATKTPISSRAQVELYFAKLNANNVGLRVA